MGISVKIIRKNGKQYLDDKTYRAVYQDKLKVEGDAFLMIHLALAIGSTDIEELKILKETILGQSE
jgi:hypothetical protein